MNVSFTLSHSISAKHKTLNSTHPNRRFSASKTHSHNTQNTHQNALTLNIKSLENVPAQLHGGGVSAPDFRHNNGIAE